MPKETQMDLITKIADFQEIQNLQAKYGYYLSRTMWGWEGGELPELFTDDAEIELGARGIFVGKEGVKKVFGPKGMIPLSMTSEYLHVMLQVMPYIQVYKDNTASALWSLFGFESSFATVPGQTEEKEGIVPQWLSGRYAIDYRKVDDVWKIRRLTLSLFFKTPFDQGWSKAPIVQSKRKPFASPDKPSVQNYKPYNPQAKTRDEQMRDAIIPPDIK
jgi:hypothetical protein